MSFNKVILVGNLGRDPELRYTPAGDAVCSFSMATNESRKGKSEGNVTWFRVTTWRRMAETASQYLTKGRPVYIEGRLRVEEFTDRDGKVRRTLEVTATDMQFIGGGGSSEGREERASSDTGVKARAVSASGLSSDNDGTDDDIPF